LLHYSETGWKWTDIIVDLGMRLCDLAHQDFLLRVERVSDITEAKRHGQIAWVPGLEAATMIETELDRLDVLDGSGVRQMGITYNEANALGSGHREQHDGGLSDFGRKAVTRMNRLGMAIDISHTGDVTGLDVVRASTTPTFISHAGCRSVWNTSRMKTDEVIIACAERGGDIGLEAARPQCPAGARRELGLRPYATVNPSPCGEGSVALTARDGCRARSDSYF
jgi:membrane dipeptidase